MNKMLIRAALLSLGICIFPVQSNCMDSNIIRIGDNKFICKQLLVDLIGETFGKMQEGTQSEFDFECDKEILPILDFTLQVNSVFEKCALDKSQIFERFLHGIKTQKLDRLSILQLIEFANILDKYFFEEDIMNAVCYLIAEKSADVELDIDSSNCSEKILIKILHYYYLLYKKTFSDLPNDIKAKALSFSYSEANKFFNNNQQFWHCICSEHSHCSSSMSKMLKHIKKEHPERPLIIDLCEINGCSSPLVYPSIMESHQSIYHPKPSAE